MTNFKLVQAFDPHPLRLLVSDKYQYAQASGFFPPPEIGTVYVTIIIQPALHNHGGQIFFCQVPTCLGIGLVRRYMGQTELRTRLLSTTSTRQMKLSARCSSGGAVTSHRACPGHVTGLVLMPSLGETSAACPMQRREKSPFLSVCIIIYSTRYIIAGVMQNVEEDTSSPYDILCILCYWKFDCINLFSSVRVSWIFWIWLCK